MASVRKWYLWDADTLHCKIIFHFYKFYLQSLVAYSFVILFLLKFPLKGLVFNIMHIKWYFKYLRYLVHKFVVCWFSRISLRMAGPIVCLVVFDEEVMFIWSQSVGIPGTKIEIPLSREDLQLLPRQPGALATWSPSIPSSESATLTHRFTLRAVVPFCFVQ